MTARNWHYFLFGVWVLALASTPLWGGNYVIRLAITVAMYSALAEAVEHGEANPEVRVMLLRANGDSFTGGNDLEDFMKNPWKGQEVPPAVRFMMAVAIS